MTVPFADSTKFNIMISYSHKDSELMMRIRDLLTANSFDVWVDTELKGGTNFFKSIGSAVIECDIFFFILTEHSVASKFCQDEVSLARVSCKKYCLLPIAISVKFSKKWMLVFAWFWAVCNGFASIQNYTTKKTIEKLLKVWIKPYTLTYLMIRGWLTTTSFSWKRNLPTMPGLRPRFCVVTSPATRLDFGLETLVIVRQMSSWRRYWLVFKLTTLMTRPAATIWWDLGPQCTGFLVLWFGMQCHIYNS